MEHILVKVPDYKCGLQLMYKVAEKCEDNSIKIRTFNLHGLSFTTDRCRMEFSPMSRDIRGKRVDRAFGFDPSVELVITKSHTVDSTGVSFINYLLSIHGVCEGSDEFILCKHQ